MTGFKSCTFLVAVGTITATGVPSLKVQESSDDSTYADLAGTAYAITDTDDDKIIAVEILNPGKRYLKCLLLRTTANCVLDGIIAILSNPQSTPGTPLTLGNEIFNTPVAGTA